jgi:hypothetical protein
MVMRGAKKMDHAFSSSGYNCDPRRKKGLHIFPTPFLDVLGIETLAASRK